MMALLKAKQMPRVWSKTEVWFLGGHYYLVLFESDPGPRHKMLSLREGGGQGGKNPPKDFKKGKN